MFEEAQCRICCHVLCVSWVEHWILYSDYNLTPTHTTNWPLIILDRFVTPFSKNERMPTIVPRYLHLDLSKHVMRIVSKLRLRAHFLKVEAAAWLEDSSRICDQCLGEYEHVQNKVHALSFAMTIEFMS